MKTPPPVLTPASRSTDPVTSHLAEEHINRTGIRTEHQEKALEIVRRNPGHTSQELAAFGELDRYQLARRLPELLTAGVVRKGEPRPCMVSGRKAAVWYSIE